MERHKKRTREIYQKQHQSIANDKKTFDRIFGIYKGQTYGLGNSFFKNKIALDAGCGNFGALTARLSNLGCDKIYACDLGKSWIKPMKKRSSNFLTKLFHQDFIVFLRNRIQAPTWLTNECDLEFINSLYKKNGFKRINRIKKFVKRTDVRKYFAPLHFMRDHWFSKILYGQGYMQFIAQKK